MVHRLKCSARFAQSCGNVFAVVYLDILSDCEACESDDVSRDKSHRCSVEDSVPTKQNAKADGCFELQDSYPNRP